MMVGMGGNLNLTCKAVLFDMDGTLVDSLAWWNFFGAVTRRRARSRCGWSLLVRAPAFESLCHLICQRCHRIRLLQEGGDSIWTEPS